MKRTLFIVLMIAIMIQMTGCMLSSENNDDTIGIRGQITKVLTNDSNVVTAIMVEGKVESDTIHDKASVAIGKNTKISSRSDGQKLAPADLQEGMNVEVVFDGPVAESYPVQGKAKTIRVIE